MVVNYAKLSMKVAQLCEITGEQSLCEPQKLGNYNYFYEKTTKEKLVTDASYQGKLIHKK